MRYFVVALKRLDGWIAGYGVWDEVLGEMIHDSDVYESMNVAQRIANKYNEDEENQR